MANATDTKSAPSTLTAVETNMWFSVHDSDGGVWWPSTEASDEIDDSDEPEVVAVRICRETPMRGRWVS